MGEFLNFNDKNNMIEIICIKDISDEEYEKYYSLLSEQKKKQVDAYKFERDKRLSVCAQMLAKKMIANKTGAPVEEIIILSNPNGKPYAKNADIEFNLSHSGDMVACALSEKPIGVDIEKMRDIDDKLIKYICTENELEYVYSAPALKLKRFFEVWTAKEAYFKCLGSGITDIKSIDVSDEKIKKRICTQFLGDYAISVYQ